MIALMEERINHLVVPAILEHEAISGLVSGVGRWNRAMSDAEMKPGIQQSLDDLLAELTAFYKLLTKHFIDASIIQQVK